MWHIKNSTEWKRNSLNLAYFLMVRSIRENGIFTFFFLSQKSLQLQPVRCYPTLGAEINHVSRCNFVCSSSSISYVLCHFYWKTTAAKNKCKARRIGQTDTATTIICVCCAFILWKAIESRMYQTFSARRKVKHPVCERILVYVFSLFWKIL